MKENNKDEGMSCLDGLYDVTRKEENVLGKKNKENNEENSQNQSQRRKPGVGKRKFQDKKGEFSLSQICGWCVHTTHSIPLLISHGEWWK